MLCSKDDLSCLRRQQKSPMMTAARIATPAMTAATAVAIIAPLLNFCFCESLSAEVVGIVVTVCVKTEPLIVTTCIDVIGVAFEGPEAGSCNGRVSIGDQKNKLKVDIA